MAMHDDPPRSDEAPASEPRHLLPLPWAIWFWRQARKMVIFVIGSTVVAMGVVMLVTPGPGWLTIFGGLVILASEFAWARWMLNFAKARAAQLVEAAKAQFAAATPADANSLSDGNGKPPSPGPAVSSHPPPAMPVPSPPVSENEGTG